MLQVLGNVAALFVSAIFACNKNLYVNLPYIVKSRIGVTRKILREVHEKWLKVAGENLLPRAGFLITSIIAARIGSYDMAIYAIGMHLMNVNFSIGSGFQTAAIALVGRSYGAKNLGGIKTYSRQILKTGLIFALCISAFMAVTGGYYFELFNKSPEFIKTGQFVGLIMAVITPFQTMQIIFNGCLRGVGDMKAPLRAAVISITIFQPPANLILAIILGLGHWGLWIAIFSSQIIQMLLLWRSYLALERNFSREFM